MFEPGQVAVLRSFVGDRIGRVLPALVVEDSPEAVSLFVPHGTPTKTRVGLDGTPIARDRPYRERFAGEWRLGDGYWHGNSTLMLTPAGARWSFWAYWEPETWLFRGWYVNLQAALARTASGFDTTDHVLDLVLAADLESWQWKDEDELLQAVELGRFTATQADAIRRDGEAALATIHARAWPFDADWAAWTPPPAWTTPTLPASWNASG